MSISNFPNPVSNETPLDSLTEHRIRSDLNEIGTNYNDSVIIFANQVDGNPLHIETAIYGPPSTSYENGVFLIDIKLSNQFPFVPPLSIIFKRATMHPNINECGKFMSDLLTPESWSPALTIKGVLEHVWTRLAVPDIDSNECDLTRAHAYRTDREGFETIAREYAIKYAAAT